MDQLKAAFTDLPLEEAAKEAFMYKNKMIGKLFETIRKASTHNRQETKLFLRDILIQAQKTNFKFPHAIAKPTKMKTPVKEKIKATTVQAQTTPVQEEIKATMVLKTAEKKAPTPIQEEIKVDLKTAEKKATTTHVQEEIKVKEPNKQKHDAKRRSTSEVLPPKKAKTESFLDHLFAFKNGETKPHHTVLHSLKKELAKDYTIPEGNEVISPQIFAESVDFIESYISEQVTKTEKDIDLFAMNFLASLKLIKDLKHHCEKQNTNYEVKFELNICV